MISIATRGVIQGVTMYCAAATPCAYQEETTTGVSFAPTVTVKKTMPSTYIPNTERPEEPTPVTSTSTTVSYMRPTVIVQKGSSSKTKDPKP